MSTFIKNIIGAIDRDEDLPEVTDHAMERHGPVAMTIRDLTNKQVAAAQERDALASQIRRDLERHRQLRISAHVLEKAIDALVEQETAANMSEDEEAQPPLAIANEPC